jgi:hypothetical protein
MRIFRARYTASFPVQRTRSTGQLLSPAPKISAWKQQWFSEAYKVR